MRRLGLIAVIVFGGLLFSISFELPDLGDAQSPASTHVSPYYIEHTLEDTSVPNIVTAILADYRGYDTLFETAVIFSAGLACFFLLRVSERKGSAPKARFYRHLATGLTLRIEKGGRLPEESKEFERIDSVWVPSDVIINMTCRLVVPFVQLFALYVIAHGHHSPGGGFQGGAILASAVLLVLRAGGAALGWGFQLQSPVLVALLAYLRSATAGVPDAALVETGDQRVRPGQVAERGVGLSQTAALRASS